jgi:hypothetical protein
LWIRELSCTRAIAFPDKCLNVLSFVAYLLYGFPYLFFTNAQLLSGIAYFIVLISGDSVAVLLIPDVLVIHNPGFIDIFILRIVPAAPPITAEIGSCSAFTAGSPEGQRGIFPGLHALAMKLQ